MLPKMEPLIPEAPLDTLDYKYKYIYIHTHQYTVHCLLDLEQNPQAAEQVSANHNEMHNAALPGGAGNHPVF